MKATKDSVAGLVNYLEGRTERSHGGDAGAAAAGYYVDEEEIEEYVAEAEAGYDLDKLRPRGRPRTGAAPARSFPVRLDPELRAALDERAENDGRPASEIVREALRLYLDAS